ncbi:MAG: tetratricopeptide repeat protein, partial [Planctomycetota bacterium]
DTQKFLSQISAEILYLAAGRIRNLEERQKVLREALQRFEDYLSEYGRRDGEVLATLAQACEDYGSFLRESIELTQDLDKRKAYEEEALDVFTRGVRACNDAQNVLLPRMEKGDLKAKIGYFLSWMRKGTLFRQWSLTIAKDKEIKAQEAYETLEELVMEIGEETPLGMTGLLEMAVALDVSGKTEDALSLFEGTTETIVDRLTDKDNPVSAGSANLLFRILERAYGHLTDIYLREGKVTETIAAVERYLEESDDLNYDRSQRYGDPVILNGARAKLDTGVAENVNQALETARTIRNRHKSDFIGIRAAKLIKAAISFESTEVSAEALYQAARGDFQEGNYELAISGFKRVLRELESDQDRQEYGLKSYYYVGQSFARRKRYLEAYFAFRKGLEQFKRLDPDTASKVADLMYKSATAKKRETKDDRFKALESDALRHLSSMTGKSKNQALWTKAQSQLNDENYGEAVRNYGAIEREDWRHELAMVRAGVAYYKWGKPEEARKALEAYRSYIKEDFNQLAPDEVQKRQARQSAVAEAEYYLGQILADEGFEDTAKNKPLKPEPLKELVRHFNGYRERYQKLTPAYALRASYLQIKALIKLERLADAEAVYRSLRKAFPKKPEVARLAIDLFLARRTLVEATVEEIKALEKDEKQQKALEEAQQRHRTEVRHTLNFASEYMGMEREPHYSILRHASNLALSIEAWDEAEIYLEKILGLYGGNPSYKERIDKHLKPELAKIKLGKNDFKQALALLEDPIALMPKNYPLKMLKARALGGWTEIDASGKVRSVSGLQRYEEAYKILWFEYNKFIKSKVKKWSLDWFQFYFDCMDMANKVALSGNSDYRRTARKFYRVALPGGNFAPLLRLGLPGERLKTLFQLRKPN